MTETETFTFGLVKIFFTAPNIFDPVGEILIYTDAVEVREVEDLKTWAKCFESAYEHVKKLQKENPGIRLIVRTAIPTCRNMWTWILKQI